MHRSNVIAFLVLSSIIFGYLYLTKYTFIDEPAHIKDKICYISCGNKIIRSCRDVNTQLFYACYDVDITLSLLIYSDGYTKRRTHRYTDYQIFCNINQTICYYDDRYIEDTLDLNPPRDYPSLPVWLMMTLLFVLFSIALFAELANTFEWRC